MLASELLTQAQLDIVTQAVAWLNGLLENAPAPKREHDRAHQQRRPYLSKVDNKRPNCVLLIDGGRGSGKTTALATLLDHLCNEHERHCGERGVTRDEKLQALNGLVVPLGFLDLEAIPLDRSLPLQVTGNLERVVEALEDRGDEERCGKQARLRDVLSASELQSRSCWRDFARAVAMAWEPGFARAGGSGSSLTRVSEIEEIERRLLDVRPLFQRFIDALCVDYIDALRLPQNKSPLFVIPIDDADMSPSRTADLLEMLRVLYHPCVAYVLTGDSDLFETTLRTTYLQRLWGNRGAVPGNNAFSGDVEEKASLLARAMLDKAIPENNRLSSKAVSVEERARIASIANAEISKFLRDFAWVGSPLPSSLRSLGDLAQWGANSGSSSSDAARVAHHLWQVAVEEAGYSLPARVRAELSSLVTIDDGILQVQEQFPYVTLRGDAAERRGLASQLRIRQRFALGFGEGVSNNHAEGGLADEEDGTKRWPREKELSARLDAASLLVLLNVPSYNTNAIAQVHRLRFSSPIIWAPVKIGGGGGLVGWPMPPFANFGSALQFVRRMSVVTNRWRDLTDDELARSYIGEALSHIEAVGQALEQPPTWPQIGERLRASFQSSGENSRWWGDWARFEFPLFSAPESGLDVSVANSAFDAWLWAFGEGAIPRHRDQVRRYRRTRLRRAMVVDPRDSEDSFDGKLEAFDARWKGYGFVEKMLTQPPPAIDWVEKVLGALKRAPIAEIMDAWPGRARERYLTSYLEGAREAALRALPPRVLERWASVFELTAGSGGAVTHLLVRLWGESVPPELRHWIRSFGTRLIVHREAPMPVITAHQFPPDFSLSNGCIVEPRLCRVPRLGAPGAELDAAASLLLTVARDFSLDFSKAWTENRETSVLWDKVAEYMAWPGLAVKFDGHCLLSPMPNLLEVGLSLDLERMVDVSNDIVAQISKRWSPDELVGQQCVDVYYAALLFYVARAWSEDRAPAVTADFVAPEEHAYLALGILSTLGGPTRSLRHFVLKRWMPWIAVFAVPELRASHLFARRVLDSLLTSPSQIAQLRHRRLAFVQRTCGLDAAHAHRWVQEMNALHPDHPWVRSIELENVPSPRPATADHGVAPQGDRSEPSGQSVASGAAGTNNTAPPDPPPEPQHQTSDDDKPKD